MPAHKLLRVMSLLTLPLLLGACPLLTATPSTTTLRGSPPNVSPTVQQAIASPSPSVPLSPAPAPSPPAAGLYGFGKPETDADIAKENIDVAPDRWSRPSGRQGRAVEWGQGLRQPVRVVPRGDREGRRCWPGAGQSVWTVQSRHPTHHRQLLALCDDALRLHLSGDAVQSSGVAAAG